MFEGTPFRDIYLQFTNKEKDGKRRKDSLKRIAQIKKENEDINLELEKAQQHIKKLRAEAGMLLEEIEHLKQNDTDPNYTLSLLKFRKRDPNMPKHPSNVFYAYCRQERPRIKLDASYTKVTRILAHKWKALNKQDQQVYREIYKKELDDYNAAMKKYHEESEKQNEDQSEKPQNEDQSENPQNEQEKQKEEQQEQNEEENDKGQVDQFHS